MIIAFVSTEGGSGESSLRVALSWEPLARGARVLVVDADPQGTVRVTGEVASEVGRPAPSIIALGKDMYRPEQLPGSPKASSTSSSTRPAALVTSPGRR